MVRALAGDSTMINGLATSLFILFLAPLVDSPHGVRSFERLFGSLGALHDRVITRPPTLRTAGLARACSRRKAVH
jgi:hypothetical protein